ncbi:MAG TPA: metallophosphoesterase [Planctomycetia bacterium]|nr:metallophosphoesterase [Planctomycetia bacterium]
MPAMLPPFSRRSFLGAALAALAARPAFGAAEGEVVDADRFALLSDIHIHADPKRVLRETNMADNLTAVVGEVLARKQRACRAFIDGDLALSVGDSADYATIEKLLQPLSAAGMPVGMTLGNHDHREHFLKGMASRLPAERPTFAKHVAVVETPRLNWFLADSLEAVNSTPGKLGHEQLEWLKAGLDARAEKPAVVFVHHHPVFDTKEKIGGIQDTAALFELIAPRKQVKAVIFGHTHHWNVTKREGVWLVNLPPVAYVFQKSDPNGWVEWLAKDGGATLTFHALSKTHAAHGKETELTWR